MTPTTSAACTAFGLREAHWNQLSSEDREMYGVIRPLRRAQYKVDHMLSHVEEMIESFSKNVGPNGTFELCPDFQRGHVWDRDKQVAFMENVFRGTAPTLLRFNSPSYTERRPSSAPDALPVNQMVCVDGLQRLTAMRDFMAGKFKVFGRWSAQDLEETPFSPKRIFISVEVFSITTRRELLDFYLDLNSGGVVHTDEELARVRKMRDSVVTTDASSKPPTSMSKVKTRPVF